MDSFDILLIVSIVSAVVTMQETTPTPPAPEPAPPPYKSMYFLMNINAWKIFFVSEEGNYKVVMNFDSVDVRYVSRCGILSVMLISGDFQVLEEQFFVSRTLRINWSKKYLTKGARVLMFYRRASQEVCKSPLLVHLKYNVTFLRT